MAVAGNRTFDTTVAVIGGGPAGAAAATIIAMAGVRVDLFERDRFPRFHVGESMIPDTYWVLQRIGMIEKLKQSRFVKKFSVQFIGETGKLSEPFYFRDYNPHESSQTWQVLRSEFDEQMLNNAAEKGVRVHFDARVHSLLMEDGKAKGLRVQFGGGEPTSIGSQAVVDCSGQSSLIASRLGIRNWDPELKKAAVWTYWKGAQRGTGIDEGATLVCQTEGKLGWFWYIPLHDDTVSVGVVADDDYLLKNRQNLSLEEIYFREVRRCPGVRDRIAKASRVDEFRVAKEYSYKSRRAAGDGWVIAGDAYGFLDPLYSSGILLALHSGQLAADAVVEAIRTGDLSGNCLGKWQPAYDLGVARMRKLVCEFYNGLNFGKFVRKHPELKSRITDILIGDLFKDEIDQLWEPLARFRQEELLADVA